MEENIKYDGATEPCSRNHGAVQQGGGSSMFQPSGNAMRQQILGTAIFPPSFSLRLFRSDLRFW